MSTPRVSIALCTYNGERFLREQLDSLLGQDYADFEIVVVDDGSRDGTVALLQDYAARDARLRFHQNATNLGSTRNFERAISLSRGEYIAPCDQDDRWHPRKLSTLLARIGDAPLVYCDSALIDESGRSLEQKVSDKLDMFRGNDPRALIFNSSVSGHAMLCTRRLIERALPFPSGSFHDWWLAQVAAATGRIEYVDEPLVDFRQHAHSSTDMSRLKHRKQRLPKGYGYWQQQQRRAWLELLRDLPGNPQRFFFAMYCTLLADWQEGWLAPELVHFIRQHQDVLFRIARRRPDNLFLRYFFGLRVKRMFQPWKYAPTGANQPRR